MASMANKQVDVIIIGAGLSGIGAGCHLKRQCPNKSFMILEGRQSMGGTWDLFRYPGVRSDSDMYTLGYNFKPWNDDKAIADGPSILNYIKEAAAEYQIERHISFGKMVKRVNWSSADALWTVEVEDKLTGKPETYTSRFILSCTGYYNYEAGYEPDFTGQENFKGQIIHPQKWPTDLDYAGKKVVIIGSGATAVTLLPAMTDKAEHVTMLQRSPSYVATVPEKDTVLNTLRRYLPDKWVYHLGRTFHIGLTLWLYRFSRGFPNAARKFFQSMVERQLDSKTDMKHFTPKYDPWDERLCAVPDGDLFKVLRNGKASVVTDHIAAFTPDGIQLKSGETLEADIIVTATGLDVQLLGGMDITIDDAIVDTTQKMCYRGVLFEDLPNIGFVFGYTNASWTLKADLITEYICRLINHMDRNGLRYVTPKNLDPTVSHQPFVDMKSGYIQRALNKVPQQGSKLPWKLYQNYLLDLAMLRLGKLDDGILKFDEPAPSVTQQKDRKVA